MAKKLNLLVDTNIFIDYFNHQLFGALFETGRFQIYYSVVTQKELLSKEGLKETERKEIQKFLKKHRRIPLSPPILDQYSELRKRHPSAGKEDCQIAATAIEKNFPLVFRNHKHYRIFSGLKLYFKT